MLKMTVPNAEIPIEHYLSQPQRLIRAITNPSQIQQLAPSHFRLKLQPLQFMALRIEPTVDLQVWTQADGMLHLRSLDCEIPGGAFLPQSFRLELVGTLSPHRHGMTTELQGRADLTVQVDVPPALKLLPDSILERAGRGFLDGILLTIKYRLERQLVQDYHRWVKANPARPTSLLAIPAGSLAS
jgi:hypothetical protein